MRHVESAAGALEGGGCLDIVLDFFGDEGNVGAESFRGQAEFDELFEETLAGGLLGGKAVGTDLLLLHQFGIGAIVDDTFPKDWGGQGAVDFLRVEVLVLSVQDEIVPFDSQAHSRLPPEQDKREDIAILCRASAMASGARRRMDSTHLFPTAKEEFVGIYTVGDRAPDKWNPVKDDRRLIGVLHEDLL